MAHFEGYFEPEMTEHWEHAKRSFRQSSWSVLLLAGLLSGGCYDASVVSNNFINGNIEDGATHIFYPFSEFALAVGIIKTLDLTGKKQELVEKQRGLSQEVFLPTESLASQVIYLSLVENTTVTTNLSTLEPQQVAEKRPA
jgi:hypothetical protein